MSPRPLIGVTGPRGRGHAMWFFAALSLWLHGARARRITPPFDADWLVGLDGLLVGGGDDISADLYAGEAAPTVRIDHERDALELKALAAAWGRPAPILGICRGAQMINVYRGGRLHQDVRKTFADAPRLWTPLPVKDVRLTDGTALRRIVGEDAIRVNSLHTQAVERLGEGLRVAAEDGHGMVQAIEADGPAFRIGVQWHPEFLFYRSAHRRLFGAFVEAARAAREGRFAAPPAPDAEAATR